MKTLEALPAAPGASRQLWVQVGTLGLCAVLLALRRPDALTTPQMWAEDALVFFHDAFRDDVASLWRPNAGYFHTWPRLLAALSLLFDPKWAPTVFAYGAWAVSIGAVAVVLWARWPGRWWTGVAAAFGLTLAPHYSEEIFLTPTNLQWLLAPVLVALLVTPPMVGRVTGPLWTVFAFLAGLTSPFIVVLVPLMVWRWWSERTRPGAAFFGALAAAALLQGGAILLTGGAAVSAPWGTPLHYLRVTGFRLGIETFVPEAVWPTPSAAGMAIVGLGVLGLVLYLGWRRGPQRAARIMLALALLGFLVTAFYRTRPDVRHLLDPGWGDRYFFSMRVLLVWLLLIVGGETSRRVIRGAAWALLLLIPFATASRYQAGARADLRWEDFAPAMREGRAVDVPIHPMGWTYRHPGRSTYPAIVPPAQSR